MYKGVEMNKRLIGLIAGIIIAVIILLLPLEGLSPEGQKCLAFSLMTVVFWATGVAQSGFVGGLYLMLLYVFKIADINMILNGLHSYPSRVGIYKNI